MPKRRVAIFKGLLIGLVGGLIALGWVVGSAGPVLAHDSLVKTKPVAGASISVAPTEIVLTFAEAPLPETAKVIAKNSAGQSVPLPSPMVDGAVVTVPWPANQPGGTYTVSWRVVSADSHPINGSWQFSYATPATFASGRPVPAASLSSPATVPSATTWSPLVSSSPTQAPTPTSADVGGSIGLVGSMIVGAALGLALAAAVLFIRSRPRNR